MPNTFPTFVRGAIDRTEVPRLLAERPAVVLERIARSAGATRWFNVASLGDLPRLCDEVVPGSSVSFYFDNRVDTCPLDDAARTRVLDLVALHGDAVVGTLRSDGLEISVEFVASVGEWREFAERTPPGHTVFLGAFPADDSDGRDAVTVTLPDSDGVVRTHPH